MSNTCPISSMAECLFRNQEMRDHYLHGALRMATPQRVRSRRFIARTVDKGGVRAWQPLPPRSCASSAIHFLCWDHITANYANLVCSTSEFNSPSQLQESIRDSKSWYVTYRLFRGTLCWHWSTVFETVGRWFDSSPRSVLPLTWRCSVITITVDAGSP